jgi:nucleoside-diphosphate-sugar epimerase
VSEGHEVVALVRNPQKAAGLPQKGVSFVSGDLSVCKNPATVIPRCDIVIHLAATIFVNRVTEYDLIDHQAVRDLVACLQRQSWLPKRFLFASSIAAGGPSAPGAPKDEDAPPCPNDPYGAAKWRAEQFLLTVPFPVTSFRPGVVYGPGDTAQVMLFQLARRGLGLRVAGVDSQFSFVYVDDLVDAILRLCATRHDRHETFFVNHDDISSVNTMWRLLGEVMGRTVRVVPVPRPAVYCLMKAGMFLDRTFGIKNKLDIREYIQMTTPAYLASSKRLQQRHGWKPIHDQRLAIEKTYHGYLEQGWL